MMLLFYAWITIVVMILGGMPHFVELLSKLFSIKKFDVSATQLI
jgi:hypothetical protein